MVISFRAVGTFSALWALLMAGLGLMQYLRFHLLTFDVGIFDQGMWLISRFQDPLLTTRGLNLFADHSSYILYAIVPIYWMFPSAGTLIVITGVFVLLQPAVTWQIRDDFHPEVLVVPLVIGAIALLQIDRNVWAVVLAAAFGASKVPRFSSQRLRRGAVAVAVVGAIGTAIVAGPSTGWAGSDDTQGQIREVLAVIPEDAAVSAWTTFVPSLASREHIYMFPNPWVVQYYGADGVERVDPSVMSGCLFVSTRSAILVMSATTSLPQDGLRWSSMIHRSCCCAEWVAVVGYEGAAARLADSHASKIAFTFSGVSSIGMCPTP